MKKVREKIIRLIAVSSVLVLSACTTASNIINPFYESPSELALMGEANDQALNGTAGKEQTARAAFDHLNAYQATKMPQPYNPVVQPSVVRLMWIPDHLNKHGDLVPAHYYYLKVLSDRWALSDAFELEGQLGTKSDASNIPFVYGKTK
jgi:hypothetical protein